MQVINLLQESERSPKSLSPDHSAGDVSKVKAVGHRVVHGRNIDKALLVDDEVIAAIKDAADLAPLHNPGKPFVSIKHL